MNNLQTLTQRSRYIQIAYKDGKYTLDASCFQYGEDMFTVTYRATSKNIEDAARYILAKQTFYDEMGKYREANRETD